MATSKPISSISYNTEEYLKNKLQKFVEAGVASFWAYIRHNGEEKQDDEAMGKDHWHVLIIPNKCVDLMEVRKEFNEFFPNDPQHPLKCLPFRTSKTDDWVLYGLHDPDYLALKGMEKSYVYDVVDFVSSDADMMHMLWVEAKQSLRNNPVSKMRQAARQGIPFSTLVKSGSIGVQQIRNAELYYQYIADEGMANKGVLFFEDGLLVLPNGDLKWEQEVFGGATEF